MYAQVYLVYPMFVPLARDTLCSRSYLGAVASLHITQGDGIPGWGCTVICQWYALTLPLPRSSDKQSYGYESKYNYESCSVLVHV